MCSNIYSVSTKLYQLNILQKRVTISLCISTNIIEFDLVTFDVYIASRETKDARCLPGVGCVSRDPCHGRQCNDSIGDS